MNYTVKETRESLTAKVGLGEVTEGYAGTVADGNGHEHSIWEDRLGYKHCRTCARVHHDAVRLTHKVKALTCGAVRALMEDELRRTKADADEARAKGDAEMAACYDRRAEARTAALSRWTGEA